MQREVNKEIERERERQRGRDSRQTDWQTQFILVFQNSFSSVHGNPSYFSFYSLQNYYLVQTRLSQEMFCGSEFSASFVLSCPWHYCILKAHHHGLTFQWPNFHPVIGQCLPHKNCPVCNPFLVQTPVCLLLSVSCFPQLLSKLLLSPFITKHQLFSHHPPRFVNAHVLCIPWIQPTTVRLISAFKQELGLSKRQEIQVLGPPLIWPSSSTACVVEEGRVYLSLCPELERPY